MPVFTPVPTLAESDVNSSTSGTVSLTFLPLLSISILIPIILFFTYRLFKRAPTLPVRLPLPAAWSQWLRGAAKGQSTKSRLPPSRVPQFIKRLSGLSQVELLPTAIKSIPTPSSSPYAYQVAFQPVPTRPGLSTAMDTRNLLSRSPSPADADDYFLSPTKPQDWDLSAAALPVLPLRPISAPPQPRSPSPKPAWSPVKEKRSPPEHHIRAKSTPFRLNITSLFTTSKPPPSRASSVSPYSHKRSKSLGVPIRKVSPGPPSPTSSLAPLIDFSISSAPVSSIGMSRTASVATEASDLGARKISSPRPLIPGLPIPSSGLERVPTPGPLPIFKLIDAPTPEKQPQSQYGSNLTETPLGPVALVRVTQLQSTPTKPPPRAQKRGRGRADEPLVRLSDSGDEADGEDDGEEVEVEAIQLKPITPMKKRMVNIPSPIALPPLPLSRATSIGQDSILVDITNESPVGSPASLRLAPEVEARTEQILVDIDQDEEEKEKAHPDATGGFKYPFPMPMTPPPTAPGPSMGWPLGGNTGEVWGWSSSSNGGVGMSNDDDPFIAEAERELERPLSPIMTMDVFEDPFADPADVTFVDEEVEESTTIIAIPSKQEVEIEPLAFLAVAKPTLEHKQEFSPWDECQEDEVKKAEEVTDVWMTEDEKTMVAAEVSRLVEDDDDEDVEVEVAVVLIDEETREPVGVVDCVVKSVLPEEEEDVVAEEEEEDIDLPTPVVVKEQKEEVDEDQEDAVPISISLEQQDDFPDPELLPLPVISAPVPIIGPQPILLSPVPISPICSVEAKSPEREIQLQTPTPPASPPPPPSLSRTTSRSRSRLQTPVPSPKLKLVVELPDDEPAYIGSITVVPPSARPVEDHSAVVTPVSPRPTWGQLDMPVEDDVPAPSLEESIPEPEVVVSSSVDEEEVTVTETAPIAVQLSKEIVEDVQAEQEEVDDEDILSSPIPGSFPSASPPAPVQSPLAEKSGRSISQVDVSAHLRHIQKPRSAIDIALAMQLRPGLGPGADPAWMVRFLMSVFGWFVVAVSGNIQ